MSTATAPTLLKSEDQPFSIRTLILFTHYAAGVKPAILIRHLSASRTRDPGTDPQAVYRLADRPARAIQGFLPC